MVATDFYRCLSNKVDHDAEVKRPSIVIHLLDKNLTGSGCKIAPGIQHGSTTGLQVSVFVWPPLDELFHHNCEHSSFLVWDQSFPSTRSSASQSFQAQSNQSNGFSKASDFHLSLFLLLVLKSSIRQRPRNGRDCQRPLSQAIEAFYKPWIFIFFLNSAVTVFGTLLLRLLLLFYYYYCY